MRVSANTGSQRRLRGSRSRRRRDPSFLRRSRGGTARPRRSPGRRSPRRPRTGTPGPRRTLGVPRPLGPGRRPVRHRPRPRTAARPLGPRARRLRPHRPRSPLRSRPGAPRGRHTARGSRDRAMAASYAWTPPRRPRCSAPVRPRNRWLRAAPSRRAPACRSPPRARRASSGHTHVRSPRRTAPARARAPRTFARLPRQTRRGLYDSMKLFSCLLREG
jgi:hypothetical protein